MSNLEQIQSILWHEIGHLCVDILLVNEHPEISINKLVITNAECEIKQWCGHIDLAPEELLTFDQILKKNSLLYFSLLSLVSGCLFQTNLGQENFSFKKCFALKISSIGKNDHDKFWMIKSKLMDLYPKLSGNEGYHTNYTDLIFESFKKSLSNLKDFQSPLEDLIKAESIKINNDFIENGSKNKYNYTYANQRLNNLILAINSIISDSLFKELIEEIMSDLIKNLKMNSKCKNNS